MNELVIVPYQPGYWQRLMEIHDHARKDELARAGLSDAFVPLAIAAEREGLFDYTVCVALLSGEAVGFVAYSEDEIAWLYVDPCHARKGIGRSLVQYVIAHTLERPLLLEVLAGNDAALALYKSSGFRDTEILSGAMPGNERFNVTVHVLKFP